MIKNFFIDKFKQNFSHQLTKGQEELIQKLTEFILNKNENIVFLLTGYAGTGKTSLVSAMVNTLKSLEYKTILLAPTGRAAKVFSSYSQSQSFTIHKKIYRQKSSNDGFGKFALDRNMHKDTLFVVDEASMIANQSSDLNVFGTGRLLDDLLKYVYDASNSCKLIFIGDTAQLPPVGISISHALDIKELQAFGLKVNHYQLTDVVRQTEKSGILFNASYLRYLISNFEEMGKYPKFKITEFKDVTRISGDELIDAISNSYDKIGIDNTLIVTRSNQRANKYNQGIRNSILWREEEISEGDLVMIVKNNYFWLKDNKNVDFIANGDTAVIKKIYRYDDLYEHRFADVKLKFTDYDDLEADVKILLDTLNINSASLDYEDSKKLYHKISEDFPEITIKRKMYEKILENPHFNALQIKFAYAVTCHKSQGGQWQNVFIDQGYITDEMIDVEYLRWLYTAITRATDKVFFVNFKDDFFE